MSKPNPSHLEHAERCLSFDPSNFAPLTLRISSEQKWIAVSQLQKAIRRGESSAAIEWAHALWIAERNYGLFRMAVIASEEIAGANPALARAFLHSDIKKTWFEERGGFSSMAYFVDAFARSTKDRTSCDLASTASLASLGGVAGPKGELDYSALRAIAENSASSLPARVSSLWLLAGTQKVPNLDLGQPRPGRLTDFLGACMAIEPEEDALVCVDLSLRLNKEPNPIALPLCRQALRFGSTMTQNLDVPTRMTGMGLTCAIDAHTREGRQAIDQLLASSATAKMLTAHISSKTDKAHLLGKLFFHLEGHDVTPRLDYALALRARDWHRNHVAKHAGIPVHELFEQGLSMLTELDALRIAQAPWAFGVSKSTPKP